MGPGAGTRVGSAAGFFIFVCGPAGLPVILPVALLAAGCAAPARPGGRLVQAAGYALLLAAWVLLAAASDRSARVLASGPLFVHPAAFKLRDLLRPSAAPRFPPERVRALRLPGAFGLARVWMCRGSIHSLRSWTVSPLPAPCTPLIRMSTGKRLSFDSANWVSRRSVRSRGSIFLHASFESLCPSSADSNMPP